jgi:hypothetical protein
MPFEQLSSAEMVQKDLPLVWEWFDYRRGVVTGCEPNAAHKAIAQARGSGRFDSFTLVTQNIDGLHLAAGSKDVIELHGNITQARCLSCEFLMDLAQIPEDERPPVCPECFDSMRPNGDVVFGVVFEGGGFRITRYRCRNGKTYFRRSGGGMMLHENEEESWEAYEDAPTASFEGVLAELSIGKDLLALKPSIVHDDFRGQVRTYIEALLGKIAREDRVRMGDYLARNPDEWLDRIRNRD